MRARVGGKGAPTPLRAATDVRSTRNPSPPDPADNLTETEETHAPVVAAAGALADPAPVAKPAREPSLRGVPVATDPFLSGLSADLHGPDEGDAAQLAPLSRNPSLAASVDARAVGAQSLPESDASSLVESQPATADRSLQSPLPDEDEFLMELAAETGNVAPLFAEEDPFLADLAGDSLWPCDDEAPQAAESPEHAGASFADELSILAGSGPAAAATPAVDDGPMEALSLEALLDTDTLPEPPAAPRRSNKQMRPLELDDLADLADDRAWQDLVSGVGRYLLDHGQTRAAALLPRLLEGEAVSLTRLPQSVQQCLVAAGVALQSATQITIDPQFQRHARLMHRNCGDHGLEGHSLALWLGPIVRALLATPIAEAQLVEDLRRAGILGVLENVA